MKTISPKYIFTTGIQLPYSLIFYPVTTGNSCVDKTTFININITIFCRQKISTSIPLLFSGKPFPETIPQAGFNPRGSDETLELTHPVKLQDTFIGIFR